MRFIAGGIMHETHTFSSEPTPLDRFRTWRGDAVFAFRGKNHSFGGTLDACESLGIDCVPTFFADALSTAPPNRATFDAIQALGLKVGRKIDDLRSDAFG